MSATKLHHASIKGPPPFEQVGAGVGLLGTGPQGVGQGRLSDGPRGFGTFHIAHVLNEVLKPWTVAVSARPLSRRSLVKVMSLSGLPDFIGDGNISPLLSSRAFALRRAPRAASDNGTRCSTPAFMRDAGMVHVRASRSISSHRAPRASPDRAVVSTSTRKHSLEARDAVDASIFFSVSGTS